MLFRSGLYPFRWKPNWLEEFRALVPEGRPAIQVAPVLERLVFPRSRSALVAWLRQLAQGDGVRWLVPAHYDAIPCSAAELGEVADQLEQRAWAPSAGSWAYLAGIDGALLRFKLIPDQPER